MGGGLAGSECALQLAARGHDVVLHEMLHAVGDGTFVVDGTTLDRREAMRSKLPPGV